MTTTTAVHKEEPSPLYLIRPLRCEGLPGADGLYQPPTRIASKIIGHEYYIDTVEVWLTLSLVDKGYIHRLEDSTKRGLQIYDGRNPTETFRRQSNRDKSRVGDRFHMRTQPWYGTKLILHGPTDATFQVLDELERLVGDGYLREKRRPIKPKRPTKTRLQQPSAGSIARSVLISRVDIAKDIITETGKDARIVGAYIDAHIVKRYPGRQYVCEFRSTRYTGQQRTPNKIASYHTRPSKTTSRPCAHFEWRMIGAQAVRRAGIKSAVDLIQFDCQEFWKNHFILRCVTARTESRLGKIHTKSTSSKKPVIREMKFGRLQRIHIRDKFQWYGSRIVAWAGHTYSDTEHGLEQSPDDGPSIQRLIEYVADNYPKPFHDLGAYLGNIDSQLFFASVEPIV